MTRFAAPIAEQIWGMKYRLKHPDGTPSDTSVEDSWRRVAHALAAVENDPGVWESVFYAAMEDFKFLPAGRVLAGAGSGRDVTLFNCFVMGAIPDSISGIFESLKEAALTMQQGGGIGYDFSTGGRCCGGRIRTFKFYGCVGCDVPHDHVRRIPARGNDGHATL